MGQKIGDRGVDKWGAEDTCTTLPGGGFIRHHDRIKSSISSLTTFCGIDYICEPKSVFMSHIPQNSLNMVQTHRVRQGLRTNFIFRVSAPSGLHERLIAYLKTISLGNKSLYKPRGRAVDVRASRIQVEYRSTAKKVDQDLDFPDGQGPTIRKLGQIPPLLDLILGAYRETSGG